MDICYKKKKKIEGVAKLSGLNKLMDKMKIVLDMLPWCLLPTNTKGICNHLCKRKVKQCEQPGSEKCE